MNIIENRASSLTGGGSTAKEAVQNPYEELIQNARTVSGYLNEEPYIYDGVYGPIPDENGFVNLDNYAITYIPNYNELSKIPEENQKYLDSGIKPTSMYNAFGLANSEYNYSVLLTLDLFNLDTSFCTNMSNAFYYLLSLQELNISSWNTSNVTNMSHMFDHVNSSFLHHLDLSNFDTSNVTDMSYMFDSVSTSINISTFNTSKVTDMSHMFYSISTLIDVSNFDTSKVTNMSYMFEYYKGNLDLSNFDTSNVTNMAHMLAHISATTIGNTALDLTNCKSVFFMFEGSNSLKGVHLKNVPHSLDFGDIGGSKGETYIIDNYID